jgi:hypothetical protein
MTWFAENRIAGAVLHPASGPFFRCPGTSAVYDHPKYQLRGGKPDGALGNHDGTRTLTLNDANRIYTSIQRGAEQAPRTGEYGRQSHKSCVGRRRDPVRRAPA